jgi:hypothetical protein
MHKSTQQFIARLSWFLAVAMFIITTFSTTVAQAQTALRTEENWVDYAQLMTLRHRESFARIYATFAEGVAVENFASCAREGTNCPSPRALPVDPSHYTLRQLRALSTNRRMPVSPGVFARWLHRAHALSGRCLMDTTIGSAIEQEWVSVHFNPRTFDRNPWNPRAWFSHRCLDFKLTVRSGRTFPYAAYRRPAEIAVTNAAHQAAGTTAQPPDLDRLRTAAHDILAALTGNDHDIPTTALRTALRTFAKAASEVPSTVREIPVPVATPHRAPAQGSDVQRQTLQGCVAVLIIVGLLLVALLLQQHFAHNKSLEEAFERWGQKIAQANAEMEGRLQAARDEAYAEGKAAGIAEERQAHAPHEWTASLFANLILGTPAPDAPVVISPFERLAAAWDNKNRFFDNIHKQGQDQARQEFATREREIRAEERRELVTTLHTALTALATRFNLTPPLIPPGEVSAVAMAFNGLVTALEQKRNEDAAATKATTLPVAAYETEPEEATEEVLAKIHADVAAIFARFGVVKLATRKTGSGAVDLVEMIREAVAKMQNAHNEHIRLLTARDTMGYGDRRTQMVLTAEEVRDLAMLLRTVLDLAPATDDRRAASPASPKSIPLALNVLQEALKSRHAADARLANDLLDSTHKLRWTVAHITGQATEEAASHPPVKDFLDPEAALRQFQTAYALLFQVVGDVSRKWVDWTSPPDDIRGLVDDVLRLFSPRTSSPEDLSYLDRARKAREALAGNASVLLGAPSN